MKPRCSLVVRACNEERHIGRLLSGVLHQTLRDLDIILIDSGSTDATRSIASRYPVRIFTVQPEDFSFGRALNAGCRAATGDIIVIASAHVYPVYEDWLERLITPFEEHTVALTYGKQRGDHRTRFSEQRVFERWFPDGSRESQGYPFCNNANAAIRRELWNNFPYNEDLTGLEDIEWAQRVVEKGYSIVYVPDAEVVHVHEEVPQQIFNRYRREAIAMKRIFPQENFGVMDLFRLWIANVVSDAAFAVRQKSLSRNLSDILTFRTMQFWGTYRGFSQQAPVDNRLKKTFYYPNSWRGSGADQSRQAKQIHYGDVDDVAP